MRQFKLGLAAAGVAFLLTGTSTSAHHAVQASVDINQNIVAEGILTSIDWINPHTWMHFDFTKADGSVLKNVMIESLGIAALRQLGINSKAALEVGKSYTISYYPNRDGKPGGFMSSMTLPNGKSFDVRNSDPTALQ